MKGRRTFGLAALLIAGLAILPGAVKAQGGTPSQLVIGLIPEMNVFKQMERHKPLMAYLTAQTGIRMKLTILSRYGNMIESFSRGQMDGAFLGSFTGALAVQQLQVIPVVRPVNLDGESTYHGLIYARRDSGIRTIADMKGKKFALVEKATTAGYIFPLAYLRNNGIANPEAFFSELFYSGSHDASLRAVLSGDAQVGASKNTVYEAETKKDPRIAEAMTILARSAPVPSNGLCLRRDLDAQTREKLKKILLEMDQTVDGREVLAKFGALKFVETNEEDYRPVIDMAAQAGITLKNYTYKNE
jgi:phosphonate transport system substrate-binding protein